MYNLCIIMYIHLYLLVLPPFLRNVNFEPVQRSASRENIETTGGNL